MSRVEIREKLMLKDILRETRFLKPVYDIKFGFRYPTVENRLDISVQEAKDVLNKLFEADYLERSIHSVILRCPSCGKHDLLTLVCCVKCGGNRLERRAIIQHLSCGYTGFEDGFGGDNVLVCPHCHAEMSKRGREYGERKTSYRCVDCGEVFGEPKSTWLCVDCENTFFGEEASVENVYVYEINEERIRRELPDINKIGEIFRDTWDVSIPAQITGRSGVTYDFSALLIGKAKSTAGKRVVIDAVASGGEVSEAAVSNFFGKCSDIDFDLSLLIVVPSLSDRAAERARALNIAVVEGKSYDEAIDKLKKMKKNIDKLEKAVFLDSRGKGVWSRFIRKSIEELK